MDRNSREVTVTLTVDEALVLDSLLARLPDSGSLTVEHPAERRALWNLHASLEKVLVEPFDPNYDELLTSARERLTDNEG